MKFFLFNFSYVFGEMLDFAKKIIWDPDEMLN